MSKSETISKITAQDWNNKDLKSTFDSITYHNKLKQQKEFIWKQNNYRKVQTTLREFQGQSVNLGENCCCCPYSLLIMLIGGFLFMALRISIPSQVEQHFCVHDQFIQNFNFDFVDLKQSPIEATLNHEKQLRMQGKPGNWKPIRIKIDYTNIDMNVRVRFEEFISEKVIPPAISFIQTVYSVYPQDNLKVNKCYGGIKIPNNYNLGVKRVDLIIFAKASYDDQNWIARGAPCYFNDITGRPIAGILEFNLKYLSKLEFRIESNHEIQSWIQTVIHEFTHILGFSQALFPTYIDPETNQRIGLRKVIKSVDGSDFIILPLIKQQVRNYFKCDQAIGALLENGGAKGSAGSHWERSTFGNEVMTASQIDNPSYSLFTFTLMELTGWYLPNYQKAEPFSWGRERGCEMTQGHCFQEQQCQNYEYEGCNFDYSGIGRCHTDQFSDPCWYWKADQNNLCKQQDNWLNQIVGGYTGVDSRCFESTLPNLLGIKNIRGVCLKAECQDNNPIFYVGNKKYICDYPGEKINVEIENSYGEVTCPNRYFCEQTRACKNDCSGAGTCRGTTCDCWDGYYGEDCSQKI